jgi:hypothetical protein
MAAKNVPLYHHRDMKAVFNIPYHSEYGSPGKGKLSGNPLNGGSSGEAMSLMAAMV